MRHKHWGVFTDGDGKVVGSATTADGNAGTVSVYLAGTLTAADVYAASSGGAAVSSVSTDTDGYFYFWVDDSEYMPTQLFNITLSHADFTSKTYEDIKIIPDEPYKYFVNATATDQGADDNTNSLKDLIDSIGSKEAVLEMGNSGTGDTTTYTLTTSETVPSNIKLRPWPGAIFDGAGTLTLDNPAQIIASPNQQIFGTSTTVAFTRGGKNHPDWFGADNTGVTDSASAINRAITAMSSGELDCVGKSYRADSTINLKSNITINGGTFDFSNAGAADHLFDAAGSAADKRALTGDVAQGAENIGVASATTYYTAGDWSFVSDDDVWGGGSGCEMGEWVHVINVNAASVDLGADLLYGYTTADTAQLEVLTFAENIVVKNVTATGADDGDFFFYGDYCKNIVVQNCDISSFAGRGIRLDRSIQFNISNNRVYKSNDSGTGYGIALVACASGTIADNHLIECRHGVSIGGAVIPTRYVTVRNNYVQSPTDAGLDSHDASEYCIWDGNTVQGGETAGVTANGIIVQGVNHKIINNTIIGVERDGIYIDNMIDNANITSSYIITNNYIERVGTAGAGQGSGIFVEPHNAVGNSPFKGLIIKNNIIKGTTDNGIFIYGRQVDIDDLIIEGNYIEGVASASQFCIWVYMLTGYTSTGGIISNNVCNRDDDSDSNIKLQSADAAGISEYSVMGNVVNNGTYGIIGSNTDYVVSVGNVVRGTTNTEVTIAGVNSVAANNI